MINLSYLVNQAKTFNLINEKNLIQIIEKEEFNIQNENREFVKCHIQRSAAIYLIYIKWWDYHNEFLLQKMSLNTKTKEYDSTLKFTNIVYNDLIWWYHDISDRDAYYCMQNFLTNHFDLAEDYGHLSSNLAHYIYFNQNNHLWKYSDLLNFKFDTCKKITYKDWKNLLKFTRKSYFILSQLLKETIRYYNNPGKVMIETLQQNIKKHSCIFIQHHVRIFLFRKRLARNIICRFVFEYSMAPPHGTLYKLYHKRFSTLQKKWNN